MSRNMLPPARAVKKSLVFVHRWMGVVLCLLFLVWFTSGLVMMYWDFPAVREKDRLQRSPRLDAAAIRITPAEAYARFDTRESPDRLRLNTFDARPVYRFRGEGGDRLIYADTGEEQILVSREIRERAASRWTGQPVSASRVDAIEDPDQWTVQGNFRDLFPLWKYSWPNGEQVYVSDATGEVVQYTTSTSRLWAYLGAIPHWLYFTPLRKHGSAWSQLVIWASGIGTIAAILGISIGIWIYSPGRRYRFNGSPTSIPYRGHKRWHTVFGLIFGIGAATWAFSGMLSMDPFPIGETAGSAGGLNVAAALHGPFEIAAFEPKRPTEALNEVGDLDVKELELTSFTGEPVYLATNAGGETRVIPVRGGPMPAIGASRIARAVEQAAGPNQLSSVQVMEDYDSYYLDRHRERPLPVVLVRLNDPDQTRYYIDPTTARIVTSYSSRRWMNRWLYHGLHSLDFPWLYRYRPLWDIVVVSFMLGGTTLCVTSLILAWRVVRRKLEGLGRSAVPGDDLALEVD